MDKSNVLTSVEPVNPFRSNFSANRILPQLLFVLGGKEVGGLRVIILQF